MPYAVPHSEVMRGIYALSPVVQADTVMLGDSHTEYFPWAEVTACSLINRGIGGETSQDILARIGDISRLRPKYVFLMVGTNDVSHHVPPQQTLSTVKSIVAALAPAKVYVVLPPPFLQNKTAMDKLTALYRDTFPTTVIDPGWGDIRTVDGVHLMADGYAKWLKAIKPHLQCN
jgi:lysophospholipase L1-like esterase